MGIRERIDSVESGLLSENVALVAEPENTSLKQGVDERIDQLELMICAHPGVIELPVEHKFTPGMYVRTLTAPAGTIATTYIHKQEHQFVLVKGIVSVFADVEETKVVRLEAPYHGITKAGTRRVIFVHEDCIWMTFHPTDITDIDEAEKALFDFRTLEDGTNVKDRFKAAVEQRRLAAQQHPELTGGAV